MDTRSMKILSAIVDEYIRTGEPVGSKALAEKPDISVSSATIRNTMAALEQEGYLYAVSGRGSFVAPESEWREGKKKKMLDEWRQVTERAKEAGLGAEELKAELDRAFGEGLK